MNALATLIRVRHVRSANPFEYWRPMVPKIMLEPFKRIHFRAFPPINVLSKSKWNRWGKRPAYDLNCSSAKVIDVDDSDDIPYSQQYLLSTSTKIRAYQCPPMATQSPKTMSIWNFLRYWCRFLIVFPLVGFLIVAKEPIVDGRRPEFTILALVSVVRFFWLRNCLQPKMRWIFRYSYCFRFLHGSRVDEVGIGGILVASLWTRLIVRMESGSMEFLWRVVFLGSVGVTLVKGWGRQLISIEGGRGGWK